MLAISRSGIEWRVHLAAGRLDNRAIEQPGCVSDIEGGGFGWEIIGGEACRIGNRVKGIKPANRICLHPAEPGLVQQAGLRF